MCKTNVKMNFYYVSNCKHEHEKNMTRLWCKIVPKTNIEQTKRNEGFTFIYTPLGPSSKNIYKKNFMCASSKKDS